MPILEKLILGSKSPRRQEILGDAGFDFKVIEPQIVERYPADMNFYNVAEYISKLKMFDVYSYLGDDAEMIICADTIVIFEKKILGKPKNIDYAFRYLNAMNGKTHEVVTGITMRKNKKQISFSETTKVHFKMLDEAQIHQYIKKYNPLDKAGAYNIQEYNGVEKIEGEFQNVMGLPIKRIIAEIKKWK